MSTLPPINVNKDDLTTYNNNYFNLFGLAISEINNPTLESKYYKLLKSYHQQSKTENEKIFLNEAYRTLKNDLTRSLYIKELNNQGIQPLSVDKLENIFEFFNQNCDKPNFEEILEMKTNLSKDNYFQTKDDDHLSEWMYWERLLNKHREKDN